MPSVNSVESFDSGSNYNFGDKLQRPSYPRSAFNLSHLVNTTIDNAGQVVVLDVIPTLPGDDFDITVRSLLRVLPQVVPLYSRQRMYIYAFGGRMSDYWVNFNTFMTKGYNGDVVKRVPRHTFDNTLHDSERTVVPGCLADGFGLPQGLTERTIAGSGISCIPAMMLFRIWRDYFCNRNYYVNDKVILPDDDSRFRLDDRGMLLSAVDANKNFMFDLCSPGFEGYHVADDGTYVFTQFCHDYPDDYFLSALPWPQRGPEASIPFGSGNIQLQDGSILGQISSSASGNLNGLAVGRDQANPNQYYPFVASPLSGYPVSSSGISGYYFGGVSSFESGSGANGQFHGITQNTHAIPLTADDVNVTFNPLTVEFTSSLTLNNLRELSIKQTELEKMAKTDGSYREFGLTFFNEVSKNAVDFRPVYIGGSYTDIHFTEVLQTSLQYKTSGDTPEVVGSPLGTEAGHGVSVSDSYLGHYHSDDFGYIMILGCIMPDVYYSQGLARHWTASLQSDFFLPERARLGMRPILNKELFFTGDSVQDDSLWAWQDPFDEFRYIPNRIAGKIADSSSESFFPYTQSRRFDSLPNYGPEFAYADEVRKDYLAAPSEVAYSAQFAMDIRAVRPLSYRAVPADLIH